MITTFRKRGYDYRPCNRKMPVHGITVGWIDISRYLLYFMVDMLLNFMYCMSGNVSLHVQDDIAQQG